MIKSVDRGENRIRRGPTFFLLSVIEKKNNLLKSNTKFDKKQVLLSKKESKSHENDKPVDVDNFVEIGDFFGILRGFSKKFLPKDVEKSENGFWYVKIEPARSIEMFFAKHRQ